MPQQVQKNITLSQMSGRAPKRVGTWANLLAVYPTDVGDEDAGEIDVEFQLITDDGDTWVGQEVFSLRVADTDLGPASASAILSLGDAAKGAILEGSGTAEIRVQTDTNGQFSVKVTEASAANRYLMADTTVGNSHYVRGFGSVALVFAGP